MWGEIILEHSARAYYHNQIEEADRLVKEAGTGKCSSPSNSFSRVLYDRGDVCTDRNLLG